MSRVALALPSEEPRPSHSAGVRFAFHARNLTAVTEFSSEGISGKTKNDKPPLPLLAACLKRSEAQESSAELRMTCESCGSTRSVQAIKSGFQAVSCPLYRRKVLLSMISGLALPHTLSSSSPPRPPRFHLPQQTGKRRAMRAAQ